MQPRLKDLMSSDLGQVLTGTVAASTMKVLGVLLWLAFFAVLGRRFGPPGVGAFAVCFSLVTVASALGRIGLDNVVVRKIAAHDSPISSGIARQISGLSLSSCALVSIPLGIAVWLSSGWLGRTVFGSPDVASILATGAWAIPLVSLTYLQAHVFRGCGRIALSQFIQSVAMHGSVLVLYVAFGSNLQLGDLGLVLLAASAIAFFAALAFAIRLPRPMTPSTVATGRADLIRSGLILLPVSLASLATQNVPVLFMGAISNQAETGLFHIASRLANLLAFMLMMVNFSAAPRFARLYREGANEALAALARRLSGLLLAFGVLPAVVLMLAPGPVLDLFGTGFARAASPLRILVAAQMLSLACGSVNYLLMMSGHERQSRNIATGGALVTVAASLLLIPVLDATGAAIAVAAGLATANLLALRAVRKKLGFWATGLVRPSAPSD